MALTGVTRAIRQLACFLKCDHGRHKPAAEQCLVVALGQAGR
jgi:hypothetical protein